MSNPGPTNLDLAALEALCAAATPGLDTEKWRPIPGFEDYEVSDWGNVRTLLKRGNHAEKKSATPRLLKLANRRGYRTVGIRPAGSHYRTCSVHALVLLAFVGPRPSGMEIAHLNGDPADNRLSNLKYCTHEENESHKVDHGTSPLGERNGLAKLQEWQVEEMRYLNAKGIPYGRIAALFDVHHMLVAEVCRGENWKHVQSRDELRTALPALIERVKHLEHGAALSTECVRKMVAEREKSVERIRTLEAALRRYGQHGDHCRVFHDQCESLDCDGTCDCGLAAALGPPGNEEEGA